MCEISDYLLNCSLKIHLSVSRLENIALLSAVNLLLAINSLDNYQKKQFYCFLSDTMAMWGNMSSLATSWLKFLVVVIG